MIGFLSTLLWFAIAHDPAVSRDPSASQGAKQTTEPWSHRWAAVKTPASDAAFAEDMETGGKASLRKLVRQHDRKQKFKKLHDTINPADQYAQLPTSHHRVEFITQYNETESFEKERI